MVQYKYLVSRPFSKGVGSGEQGIEKRRLVFIPRWVNGYYLKQGNELLAKPSSSFRLYI